MGAANTYSAMTKLEVQCNPSKVIRMTDCLFQERADLQITLLNVKDNFPCVEAFFDEHVMVLIQT